MLLAGLDFETANGQRGAICQAGVALVQDGSVVRQWESYVRPRPGQFWFSSFCTRVHGITMQDVRFSPEFPELWPRMQELLLQADYVIAHNAPFDLAQLRECLRHYDLPCMPFRYADSCRIARHAFPQLPSHSLDAVATHLRLPPFHHHDALEDAATCALIADHLGIPDHLTHTFQSP